MANYKWSDDTSQGFPISSSIADTDYFMGLTPTWNAKYEAITVAQYIAEKMVSIAANVYVSPANGSDITGTGTINNPYQTIAYAQSQIALLANSTNPYNLILSSEIYNENDLEFNPYVYIIGNNATLEITNSITLSSNWNTNFGADSVNFFIKNCSINCVDGIILSFDSFFQQDTFLSFNDILTSQLSISGNGFQNVNLKDCGNIENDLSINFADISVSLINGCIISGFSNVNSYLDSGVTSFLLGNVVFGISSIGAPISSRPINQFFIGTTCFSSPSIGGSASATFYSDCNILSVPILNDGAQWVPLSIASGVVMQYTPVNFTYTGGTVDDYFEGVDNKFGELTYAARVNATTSVSLTTPIAHQVYVNMVSAGQHVKLPQVNVGGVPTIAVGQKIYFEISDVSEIFEIQYYDSSSLVSLDPGRALNLVLNDNSTSNGTWIPEYLVISVNGLDGEVAVTGLNVDAEYPSPTGYTPTSVYVEGHLKGINDALLSAPTIGSSSFGYMVFNPAGPATAAFISFVNTTTYLPPLTQTAPACYSKTQNFTVGTDGNQHTVFTCNDSSPGDYELTVYSWFVTNTNANKEPYAMNCAVNGFTLSNINTALDVPFNTYGTTDDTMLPVVFQTVLTLSYGDFVYPCVIRSTNPLVTAPNSSMRQRYIFAVIKKMANLNSEFLPYTVISGTSSVLLPNNRYLCTNESLTTLTLPTIASQGQVILLQGQGSGLFTITQNAGQSIVFGTQSTTTGVSGSFTSLDPNSVLNLTCSQSNSTFMVTNSIGNFTIV